MQQRKPGISIGYHPTTVLIVEDNKEYLKNLNAVLVLQEKLSCLAYDDPQKALQFLNDVYQPSPFTNHCLFREEDNPADRIIFELDIRSIHDEIYSSKRFAQITVLVIDYAMPTINGLDFCRQLRKYSLDSPIKIIMLTGEASKDLAVEAFNEGSIDKFISKDSPDIMDILVHTIREFQLKYFLSLSDTVINKIDNPTLACLSDPIFMEFFNQICQSHNIVEYYLLDEYGSFLLLDTHGKPSWLAVTNEEMMQTYLIFAEGDNAPTSVIDNIKTKKYMPFFFSDADFCVRPSEWERYLHPVQALQGKEIYYYSYIANQNAYHLDEKIFSYDEFLQKQ